MIEFKKVYTRDTSVIMQQAWYSLFAKEVQKHGWTEDYGPAVVHYMKDGTIEIWENLKVAEYIMEEIYKKNSVDDSFFETHTTELQKVIDTLQVLWDKEYTDSIDELKQMVDLIFDSMFVWVVMYFTAMDDRTPEPILEKARKMRDVDVYFDASDRFIRKSLLAIYPELKGTETTVLRRELEQLPDEAERTARKQHLVLLGEVEDVTTTLEEYAAEHPEYIFKAEHADHTVTELKGSIGYKGKATGKVKIAKRKEQIMDVQEGEVLVAPMTTPDYVPAMKKAAAIVTDEGGITCHAAIVARELQKPCVIATKFATEVLKDGMEVEVDAEKGVVTIL